MHRLLALLPVSAAASCGSIPKDLTPGQVVHRKIQQQDSDSRLGTYDREYLIQLPQGYTGAERVPVLFYFHGWGDDFKCSGCHFKQAANKHGFIVVKPNGMTDGQEQLRSWNVGQAGRTDICNHKDVAETEYTSCLTTQNTSICNCGTCYDDVRFISDLAASLKEELCIDDDRIFATGGSFGALFDYFLPAELERQGSELRLRGILPWYGAFYRNMENVPPSLKGTSLFHFHGIHDTEIPMDGSESDDGYLYVPIHHTWETFARVNGCSAQSKRIVTPWDGKGQTPLLGCQEWAGCEGATRVVRCNFDGEHGLWPSYAEELMAWFFLSLGSAEVV